MDHPAEARLLILDDDDLVGMLVESVGRLSGLATRLTLHHQDFFAAVAEWPPSHIFVDLTMPGMDGEAVLRELARRACGARIVISSGVDAARLAEAAEMARQQGLTVAGTLPKPFSPSTLRALLRGA